MHTIWSLVGATASRHVGLGDFRTLDSSLSQPETPAPGENKLEMFLGVSKKMAGRLGWTAFGYGAVQAIRLLNNVILARLLAPSIFGVMAVVNSIRTGFELLSDVGILQNIVSNPQGAQAKFYNTAWTIQAIRGVALGLLCLLIAKPMAIFFESPDLAKVLPLASLFFIFHGFHSTASGIIHKDLKVLRLNLFEIGLTLLSLLIHVVVVFFNPTIAGLVLASVLASASMCIMSYLYIPRLRHQFMIDPDAARQLFSFGKWVFLSSIVYFFAMNFDRLYFAKEITFAELGVYGIARGLSDMFSLFVMRCGSFVLFPTVAASAFAAEELRHKMLFGRRTLLAAAAAGIGVFFALGPVIVRLLYDARYHDAGPIVQILCIGVWFNILTSTNDSILLGLGRAAYPALANTAKLVTYIVGVPLAFHWSGFTAAIAVISAGEFVKYVALWALSHKEHLRFGRDDLVLTLVFMGSAVAAQEIVSMIGWSAGSLVLSVGQWVRP